MSLSHMVSHVKIPTLEYVWFGDEYGTNTGKDNAECPDLCAVPEMITL